MTSDQIAEIEEAIRQIYDAGYYTHLWEQVYRKLPGALETLSYTEGLKVFQDFWSALPDSKSIRSAPFFTVCDMAERYCEAMAGDYFSPGELPQDEDVF